MKTEQEMREAQVPAPETENELCAYISSLINHEHDYGTCVYAISMAAIAAYNYVAHKLGASGFQASCADLDIVRRTRRIQGPFMLIKGEDMLYPQYDLHEQLSDAMREWSEWAAEQAKKLLSENDENEVHPHVWKHWEKLAGEKQ